MVSAGVSGSTSAGSTSGYGSADSHPHHARQDRVEMWVREQQYVRQNSASLPPPARPSEQEQLSAMQDRWNPQRSVPSIPFFSDDQPRPPVPLYSSWGESEHISGAETSGSAMLSNEQSQISLYSAIP